MEGSRRRASTIATVALAVTVATIGAPARADCVDGRPIDVGHRGTGNTTASNPYPENTIPSLLAAGEEGATMVELDVQLSADGIPVLMHDALVDGTTDGMGCVTELTLDELKMLDAGVGSPMEGMGVRIPTLEEVLEAVPLDLNIELKYGGEGCPEPALDAFATAVLDVLAADPMAARRWQTMSSFELPLLEAVRQQDGSIYLGLLSISPALTMTAADADMDAINLNETTIDQAAVTEARDLGLEINAWTVDDPARIELMFELDVDSIITNEPPEVEAVRRARCPSAGDTGTTGGEADSTAGPDATTGTAVTGGDTEAPGGTGLTEGTTSDGGAASGDAADDAGCGCRSGDGSPTGSPWATWAWLLGFGAIARRRDAKRLAPRAGSATSRP